MTVRFFLYAILLACTSSALAAGGGGGGVSGLDSCLNDDQLSEVIRGGQELANQGFSLDPNGHVIWYSVATEGKFAELALAASRLAGTPLNPMTNANSEKLREYSVKFIDLYHSSRGCLHAKAVAPVEDAQFATNVHAATQVFDTIFNQPTNPYSADDVFHSMDAIFNSVGQ